MVGWARTTWNWTKRDWASRHPSIWSLKRVTVNIVTYHFLMCLNRTKPRRWKISDKIDHNRTSVSLTGTSLANGQLITRIHRLSIFKWGTLGTLCLLGGIIPSLRMRCPLCRWDKLARMLITFLFTKSKLNQLKGSKYSKISRLRRTQRQAYLMVSNWILSPP